MPTWLRSEPRIRGVLMEMGPMANPQTTATNRPMMVSIVTNATRRAVGGLAVNYFCQSLVSLSVFFTTAVNWFIKVPMRGPQRDEMSGLSSTTLWYSTALTLSNPARLATLAGDTESVRKINLGLALMMYSALSWGYPASAVVESPSAILISPSDFMSEPANVWLVSE